MALNQIPTLPESYPLFDWADYQSSRDALVQGGATIHFAKAAWNAIVDGLADALAESGVEWDETYTTAEGARMTDTDGQLTAAKFNSVRLNIDRPAPLGWVWAHNPGFRGYLNRVEIRGVADSGRRCDVVYPEYIIELARKLNTLLEIMRGTGLIADVNAEIPSRMNQDIDLRVQPSAPVELGHSSVTNVSPGLAVRPSAPINAEATSSTNFAPGAVVHPSIPVSLEHASGSRMHLDAVSRLSAPVDAQAAIGSCTSADMQERLSAPMESEELVKSATIAQAHSGLAVDAGAEISVESTTFIGMDIHVSADVATEQKVYSASSVESAVSGSASAEMQTAAKTAADADAVQSPPTPIASNDKSTSCLSASADQSPPAPAESEIIVGSSVVASADFVHPLYVRTNALVGSASSVSLGTAWYPPEWVGDGLWIRQSHGVTQNENGELVII